MSWILAFVGFALLILLHEAGHFAAAKAVGMRVERFSLFFGKPIVAFTRGETEYVVGSIPLGGFVKIAGMAPDLPGVGDQRTDPRDSADPRGYYRQAPWKRIVVIFAGPLVNLVIAFVIFWGLFLANGVNGPTSAVFSVQAGQPAAGVLMRGDHVLSVDGVSGSADALSKQITSHTCAGTQTAGCAARTPVTLMIQRGASRRTVHVTPRYDASLKRPRLGISFIPVVAFPGVLAAASKSVDEIGSVTSQTVSVFAGIFYSSQQRKQVSSVIGGYERTREAIGLSLSYGLGILALVSLSLAVINLAPFLPLDGGHIFWAIAEKVRGRAIPFAVMERSGMLGLLLIGFIFLVGLSNDIGRLTGSGFGVR